MPAFQPRSMCLQPLLPTTRSRLAHATQTNANVNTDTDSAAPKIMLKRRWDEREWETAMEAQSFIAILADTRAQEHPERHEEEEEEEKEEEEPRAPTRRRSTRGGRPSKRARKQTTTAPPSPTTVDAIPSNPEPTTSFWLAQLQDDIPTGLLGTDASVRITWFNPYEPAGSSTAGEHRQYVYAYDDYVEVQSILCHVYLIEISAGVWELTEPSAARIQRSLRRSRGELDEEESGDEEQPPTSKTRKHRKSSKVIKDESSDEDGGQSPDHPQQRKGRRIVRARRTTRRGSKRATNMHVPPKYATVPLEDYAVDRELDGDQAYEDSQGDSVVADRQVIRAVRTGNHDLLKFLTEDSAAIKTVHSFHAWQSADVAMSAMEYAMQADDVNAVAMLLKTRSFQSAQLARAPDVSLPSHSTGQHTSAFSDYNRRSINASRGGKEGNNALLGDCAKVKSTSDEDNFFWTCPTASLRMLTVLYPSGNWSSDYTIPQKVAQAARVGNHRLVRKIVETLNKNGGWGFNELHVKALSAVSEELPKKFRATSVVKQAQQTKIRPLHLAAINPNAQYLKAMWDVIGTEHQRVRDDRDYEPMHYAAVNECADAVRFLLERNCGILARTKEKHTPAMLAIMNKREENAIAMLEYFETGASELMTDVINCRGPDSHRLIHFASKHGCTRVLEKLLTLGADVNAVASNQTTALSLAARQGHRDCVNLLLLHGAKVDQSDKQNKTPLIYAVKNGFTHIAAILINNGANVNAYDTSDNTVAHYASSYGWLASLQLLHRAGADIWVQNSWGFVPLVCAMLKQRLACTEFILGQDATDRFMNFRDRQGCTMLFLQCRHGKSLNQIEFLLGKNLDPNIGNADYEYPIQALISRCHMDASSGEFYKNAIHLLIQHGAHTVLRSGDSLISRQPILMAIEYDLKDIFDLLLTEGDGAEAILDACGTQCFVACASLGGKGTHCLRRLLELSEQIEVPSRSGDNFFLSVAMQADRTMLDASVVEMYIKRFPEVLPRMNEKGYNGMSPLMLLLSKEPTNTSRRVSSAAASQDKNFCAIARIFAKATTNEDALVQYVMTWEQDDAQQARTVTVYHSTVLHLVANRTLSTAASNPPAKWHGDDLMDLVLQMDNAKRLIDRPDKASKRTPLLIAVNQGDYSSVRTLVGHGANVNYSTFRCESCKDLETQCPDCASPRIQDSALVNATKRRDFAMVKLLVESGAAVECCESTTRQTPLHIAMSSGDVELTKYLLQHGASLRSQDASGCTALMLAVKSGCSVQVQAPHQGEIMFSKKRLGRGVERGDETETTDEQKASDNTSPQRATGFQTRESDSFGRNVSMFGSSGSFGQASTASFGSGFGFGTQSGFTFGQTPTVGAPVGGFSFAQSSLFGNYSGGFGASSTAFCNTTGSAFGSPNTECVASFGSQPQASTATTLSPPSSITVVDVATEHAEFTGALLIGDEFLRTPVHYAAEKRDIAVLRVLLPSGCAKESVNASDVFGRSPLHYALNSASMRSDASFDVERFLLISGADIKAADNFGFSVLHYALRKVDMDWHIKYDRQVIQENCLDENDSEMNSNAEAKKSEAFISYLTEKDAVAADPVETVSNLIAAGADPLMQDCLCRSALHLAASAGAFVCASTLLSAFSGPRRREMLAQKDVDGFTPLGRAFLHSRETTITTLIQGGACVSDKIVVNGREYSYFSHAVHKSMIGICHMLLNAGFSRRQAVEDAVSRGELQLATNLMIGLEVSNEEGLLTRSNQQGETLLHCLAKCNRQFDHLASNIAWTLIDDGLQANMVDNNGNTALHVAAEGQNVRLMDFLIHHGCDINLQNTAGDTPLMHAIKSLKAKSDERLRVFQYFLRKSELDLGLCDDHGLDALGLFIDCFLDEFARDPSLYSWLEALIDGHGHPDRSYPYLHKEDLFCNPLLDTSLAVSMPLIIRVVYAKSGVARVKLMKLLVEHGADVCTMDTNGNSVITHLVARNAYQDLSVLAGLPRCTNRVMQVLHTPNNAGKIPLHIAVSSHKYGSFENLDMIKLLLDMRSPVDATDSNGETIFDYAQVQASGSVLRLLQERYPTHETYIHGRIHSTFPKQWHDAPDFVADAASFIAKCEQMNLIKRSRQKPTVNRNCDVGRVSSVYGIQATDGSVIDGEEFDVLLTKVDVKNGRFGVNVFYRSQVVYDELQAIYIVFTNWGRIGETGKFQNTPFRSAAEAVDEFKKIFKSKTGNNWENRNCFVKHTGKYKLVQRADFTTEIDSSITESFVEARDRNAMFIPSPTGLDTSVTDLLFAVTDVRNLRLAARERCNYYEDLPLANDQELHQAMDLLQRINVLLKERIELNDEIETLAGNITDDATTQLSNLSERFGAMTDEIADQSSRYYEIVPRNEDRMGSAIKAFETPDSVGKEIYRLKQLMDITHTYKMILGTKLRQRDVHPMNYIHDAIQIQVQPLNRTSNEHHFLSQYFFNGLRPHDRRNYKLSNIFEVSRRGESERFNDLVKSKSTFSSDHSRLLWHGTRRTNLMGILSEGLRIAPPEAPHHGYAYGKGLYFADVAAKSLQYCGSPYSIRATSDDVDESCNVTNSTRTRQVHYMLLCEVALGRQTNVDYAWQNDQVSGDGVDSICAVGRHSPEPAGSLVSPYCGVKVPMGRVGRSGIDHPVSFAWATSQASNNSSFKWSMETEGYLNELVEKASLSAFGVTVEADAASKRYFVDTWFGPTDKTIVRIQVTKTSNLDYDAAIKIAVTSPNSTFTFQAHRYRDVLFTDAPTLPLGFTFQQPTPRNAYNEHVVYNTAQARIRYLVEVELQ